HRAQGRQADLRRPADRRRGQEDLHLQARSRHLRVPLRLPRQHGRIAVRSMTPMTPMRKASSVTKARQVQRWFLVGAVALMAFLVAGCADSSKPQDVLRPAGDVARTENKLWVWVFPVAVFVFILVEGLIVYIAIRFKARSV